MNNNYEVIKNTEKIQNGESTKFLDLKMQLSLKNKLKKNEYKIYKPYEESEKVIFYSEIKPQVCLLEIICKDTLKHSEILGTIFSLGLDSSVFGDIIISNSKHYIYVLDEIKDYIRNNLLIINKKKVLVEERSLDLLKDFEREYLEIELITSSERIDTIVSRLININRTKVKKLAITQDILLNYNIVSNISKKLEVGDIFSIRKYGKYRYLGVIKTTKSGNLVVKIDKYC